MIVRPLESLTSVYFRTMEWSFMGTLPSSQAGAILVFDKPAQECDPNQGYNSEALELLHLREIKEDIYNVFRSHELS